MKKITTLLCMLLCAVMLMAPLSNLAHAVGTGTASDPYILTSMPYETTINVTPNADGVFDSYFYQYTATRACRLKSEVTGSAAALITQNGEQVYGAADMAVGDVIVIELFPLMEGEVVLKLWEEDFPLGSRQNPISLNFNDLKAGYTFDLTQEDERWYKVTAPETGVLDFSTTNMGWGFFLGFNGNSTSDGCSVLGDFGSNPVKKGSRPINAGETFLLCAEYVAAEPGSFKVKVDYVPPFTIDTATQKTMFDGLYAVQDGDGKTVFGVEFDYDSKIVSALDLKNNQFLGTYSFNYNLANGALELTNKRGQKAPYTISVIEDASKPEGAYLKLTYNGQYELKSVEEAPAISQDAINLLNGRFEDIFLGEVYETFVFVYETDTYGEDGELIAVGDKYVIVAPDWQSEGVVYHIESYSAFSGMLVLKADDGDVITMTAAGGQIIYNDNVLTEIHEHEYRETVKHPTCLEGGYTEFVCSCGESYTGAQTEALGHAWVEATCDTPKTCSNCGLVEGEALGHAWVEATCEAPKTCSNCGLTEGEALGHAWSEVTCETPKTCSTCGATEGEAPGHAWVDATCETAKTCSTCGAIEGEALGHSWVDATCETAKTCSTCGTVDGKAPGHKWVAATCDTAKTCSTCGAVEGEALGHAWANATCELAKICTRCGVTEGAALGHTWVNATCTTAKTCSACGTTEGAALGHKWAAATCEAAKTCTVCGATEGAALGHAWENATCETAKTCATCGATEGAALGHSYGAWIADGDEHKKTCANCGDVIKEAHAWDDGVVTKEPTEDMDGEKKLTCTVCGGSKTQVLPSVSHVHSYTATITDPTCTNAGYTTYTCRCGDSYVEQGAAALGHSYRCDVVAPTCTEAGYTTCTCNCGDNYVEQGAAALGHNYQDIVTVPTCAAGGYTTHTCAICGDEQVDSYVDALGHKYNSVVTAPTCTTAGYTTMTCSVCGNERVEHPMDALGHQYETVVTAPTCTEGGYTTHTCLLCGDEKVDGQIAAAGHQYESVVTAPTCSLGGYTTHTCSACGDVKKDSSVAPTGHKYGSVVTAPTCTEGGYTTHTCSVCGDVKVDSQTDPVAHTYDAGVANGDKVIFTCTACGHTYESASATKPTDIQVPGALTGTVDGTKEFTWTATEDGFLQIDNAANLTGAYHSVTINGVDAIATEEGYAVEAGDQVVITITTFSAVEINISVAMANSNVGGGESPMEFDVTWPAGSWNGYSGAWYAPADGVYSFIIDASNIPAAGLTFRIIVNDNWYNQYEFPLTADGKQYISVSLFAGDSLTIMAYDDAHTEAGELHIVVIEGEPALHEHAYGEGVVTTEPTCNAEGVMTYTCECGETKTEKVQKLPHTEEIIPGKAPTCTEAGLTEGVKCSVCGESITVQTEIPETEHTYGNWEVVKEATTTEEGSRKRVCSACGAEEVESIPMIETQPTEPATKPTDPTDPTEPEETDPADPTEPATVPATTGGNNADEGGDATLIIVIAVVSVIAGAIVAVVLLKKKK